MATGEFGGAGGGDSASSSRITITFKTDSASSASSSTSSSTFLSTEKLNFQKPALQQTFLSVMLSDRWQEQGGDTSTTTYDIDTTGVPGWSGSLAETIKQFYESEEEDVSSMELTLPVGIELQDAVCVFEYFGIDVDLKNVTPQGSLALYMRAQIYTQNVEYVAKAYKNAADMMRNNPKSCSRFIATHDFDNINHIKKHESEPINEFALKDDAEERSKHYEWTTNETFRDDFAKLVEDSELKVDWKYTEVKIDVWGKTYSRWIATITLPAVERPSKRACVEPSLSSQS